MPGAPELAQYPNFTISVATASTFASKKKIAHVSSFNLNDSYDVATVTDFDTALGSIAALIPTGRTISVSFDANTQLSDEAQQMINAAHHAGTYMYLEIEMKDTKDTVTTATMQLGGRFTNRSFTGQTPVATGSYTFSADELLSDTFGG